MVTAGWNDESSLTQLWQTDGTPAGTSEVQLGGGPFTDPSDLRIAGGALYFLADSPDGTGTSLWRTDGTAAGTAMLGQFRGTIANPNRPGGLTSLGSGFAFHADDGVHGIELWALPLAGPSGCQPSATALCLSRGRFEVKAFWRDFQGGSGTGQTLPLTSDTGTFWFFSPNNLEVIVKVIDGRALNGYFWVFYGALSSVEYALTVTDTVTGLAQRYFNPLGDLSSAGDTTAFGPLRDRKSVV